jgi:hypothetical protein
MRTNEQKLEDARRDIASAKRVARRHPSPRHDAAVRDAIKRFGAIREAMPLPDLTKEQRDELVAFAASNGPHWRQRLSNEWSIGRRVHSPLYALSHTHGRKWLFAFKF